MALLFFTWLSMLYWTMLTQIVWRFGAFITGRGHKPRAPMGYVDVEAHSGEILTTEQQAGEMIVDGEAFARIVWRNG